MYSEALFSAMRAAPRRARPHERLAAFAAAETRPDLKMFFELMATHDAAAVTAGDFSLWYHVGDASPDGRHVCIGATHGGDLFAVAPPGKSDKSTILLLSHEEQFQKTDSWSSLEELVEERITEHRERMQEDFPDDEDEWRTDLDEYLKPA
jgi:hypothetical protein